MWRTEVLRRTANFETRVADSRIGKVRVLRRLERKARRLIWKVFAPGGLCLTRVDDLHMYLHADTAAFQEYVLRPFEPYTVDLFRQAIRPGATVLDVGAQFGYFSLIAAQRVLPGGRVYAFEPVPSNFDLLQRNIDLNGLAAVIEPVQKAASDTRKTADIFVYRHSDSHSMYRHPSAAVRQVLTVECVPLDEYMAGRRVDVVKMDIEGHEAQALEGMERTIKASPGMILFVELNPAYLSRAGTDPRSLLARLEAFDCDVRLIDDRSRRLRPVTREDVEQCDPSWYANLYCVREERRGRSA